MNNTDFFGNWSAAYEDAFAGKYRDACGCELHPSMRGRAQRKRPRKTPLHTPTVRPSREGEVKLVNDVAGLDTRHWFKQLRRLQSMKHAVNAGSQSANAVAYRIELWAAILHSPGFESSFSDWWSNRTPMIDGSPQDLPQGPPAEGAGACLLYEEFLCHFRRFEQWHMKQRITSVKKV